MTDHVTASPATAPRGRRLPVWRRLSWRLGAAFVAVTAVAILVSGGLQYRAQAAGIQASLGALLLNIARTGTLLVNPALHLEVQLTRTLDSEAYRDLRKTLAAIQDANLVETPIYTLSDYEPSARQARFVVTSRGPGQPGEPYPLVPELIPALERTFGEGVPTTTPIYRNQSGTWLTAFAPVKGANGQTLAVLVVDYKVDDAMTHDRPYRKARPLGEALETLREGAGKQFDPRIAETALAIPAARWAELLGVPA